MVIVVRARGSDPYLGDSGVHSVVEARSGNVDEVIHHSAEDMTPTRHIGREMLDARARE